MSTRVPFGFPSLDFIRDVNLRNVLLSITQNMTRLFDGKSSDNSRVLTVQDLLDNGVLGLDRGNLYNKVASTVSGFQKQVSSLSNAEFHQAKATWSATGGKAVGSYEVGIELPPGATVTRAFYNVRSQFTSASSTAKIQLDIPVDHVAGLLAATIISSAGTVGWHAGIPTGAAGTFAYVTTTIRNIELQVTVQDLTAGVLDLYVEYVT